MHPIIVSEINDKDLQWKKITELAEIGDSKEVHKVRFSISATSSTDPAKCVRVQDKSGSFVNSKDGVKKGQKQVICLQFLAKDVQTQGKNVFTKINLVDDGKFFGIQPSELSNKKVAQ